MLPSSATVFAPAKLTVELRVTGVRDDGMHLIDSEMVTLDFGDELHLSPGSGVQYSGAWIGTGGSDDLVSRALDLLGEQRLVEVDKRVPAGAGLGGGSADAAAVLRAAGYTDLEQAARLGADVAFCLVGGRARVSGIGEIVTPLPFEDRIYTLLTPPIHCSTPAVYQAWDRLATTAETRADAALIEGGNDLEAAALLVEPELARWRDQLSDHTGKQARLAGSGSTWFVEGAYPAEGLTVARTIAATTTETLGGS